MEPFDPDYVLHPGATLQDWMDEQHETVASTAQKCGMSPYHVQEILDGKPLSTAMASQLEQGTGISANFWINYENNFRRGLREGKTWTR